MNRKYRSGRPKISGLNTKNTFFGCLFVVFSGTTHELIATLDHVMQKEPIVLLNLPSRGTISRVQNVSVYCKIDTVIQLFRWIYKWPLVQGLYKTLDPLFLYEIEPEITSPEKSAFVLGLFEQNSNFHCSARSANIKKNAVIKTKERLE